ncbi:glucose dehydrogenase [FAD, quinone]-like [Belonocnema kinseyi]|uniref:glucose dehydrogenase [FAD, quinone]-like n=1 Tax=Belonocnema kinseyi TaxID=2817044 RepID=UPI00143E01E2|nr:glucose dehydrogenase [FAD, quinone]-like [Belonocnema kinseyi]
MSWIPPNLAELCATSSTASNCQTSAIIFLKLIFHTFISSKPKVYLPKNLPEKYDFIIVGAGSAGCVLANRLTKWKPWNVLLLEAGIETPNITEVPAFFSLTQNTNVDWNFQTQPENTSCLATKGCNIPSGKVMGGTAELNGMLYARGNAEDYDDWGKSGNPGWSYKDVLPYFKKSEDNRDKEILQNNPGYHGTGGYQSVERFSYKDINAQNILKAWQELGYKVLDVNGKEQLGAMISQATVKDGQRQSTNTAYIRPIRYKRPNLFIETEAYVTKIIIDSATKTAIGVEYTSTANNLKTKKVAHVKKEVIVSAGTINSPKLLMLSGIGPSQDLQKLGIEIIKNLPVGKNFQDHVSFKGIHIRLSNKTITTKPYEQKKADLNEYLRKHSGPLSSTGTSIVNSFVRTKYAGSKDAPDANFLFSGLDSINLNSPRVESYYNTILMLPILLTPKSRGFIKLNNEDPVWGQPLIYPGYFKDNSDVNRMLEIIQIGLNLFNTKSFEKNEYTLINSAQTPCNHLTFNTDAYWICLMRNNTASMYNQVGTCKMGPKGDPEAVVNPRLKVYGVERLRVIDASIMPHVPRGCINAPTIMIAENAFDMIMADWAEYPD